MIHKITQNNLILINMKKLIITFVLLMLAITLYSQDSYDNESIFLLEHENVLLNKNINQKSFYSGVSVSPTLGLGMIGGGSMFILAGALTSPTYVGGSTTILKPWYEQPGFYPIASGAILVTFGIVIALNY